METYDLLDPMGPLAPTTPIETRNGGIVLTLYDQADVPQEMVIPDNPFNRDFVVWVRQHDRRLTIHGEGGLYR